MNSLPPFLIDPSEGGLGGRRGRKIRQGVAVGRLHVEHEVRRRRQSADDRLRHLVRHLRRRGHADPGGTDDGADEGRVNRRKRASPSDRAHVALDIVTREPGGEASAQEHHLHVEVSRGLDLGGEGLDVDGLAREPSRELLEPPNVVEPNRPGVAVPFGEDFLELVSGHWCCPPRVLHCTRME